MAVNFVSDVQRGAESHPVQIEKLADAAERTTAEQHEFSLLHASRRLDWRFLLPDPTLASVGYVGANDQPLWSALELFAEHVTRIAASTTPGESRKRFDLVVVKRPSYTELLRAVDLVRPNGFLYLETSGLLWPQSLTSISGWQNALKGICLGSPQAHLATLDRLGMSDTAAYWVWPNFARCTRITPLGDSAALRFLFAAQTQVRLPRRMMDAVLKTVVGNRRLNLLLPSVAIVARKPK